MFNYILLLIPVLGAVGLGFILGAVKEADRNAATLRKTQAILGKALQDASNADELRADLAAVESERAQLVKIAAEHAETVRVLVFAGNNLSTLAGRAASSLPGRESGLAAEVLAASRAWEKTREIRNP